MKSNYIIPIFQPHRGCRYRCIFCNEWEYTGVTAKAEPCDVLATIDQYLATIPARPDIRIEVGFYGGSFTCLPISIQTELLTPAYAAVQSGQIHGIRLSTRPDCISPAIIALLHRFGVTTVELGVQSMSDEVLWRAKRGHTADDVRRAIRSLKEAGVLVGAQLMIGLPGDDGTASLQTIDEVIALGVDFVRIHPTVVLRDTELAQYYEEGDYQVLSLDEAIQLSKAMVITCEKHGVDVIRLGLHPSEGLLQGAVVAGPFHPAFGEMVHSAIAYDLMETLLKKCAIAAKKITFLVPKGKESKFRGLRNANLYKLRERLPYSEIAIKEDATVQANTVILHTDLSEHRLTFSEYLAEWGGIAVYPETGRFES